MGQAYNESYVEVGKSKSINFCNKLFTAWDFNITDPDTAKLRRAQIKTDFEVSKSVGSSTHSVIHPILVCLAPARYFDLSQLHSNGMILP